MGYERGVQLPAMARAAYLVCVFLVLLSVIGRFSFASENSIRKNVPFYCGPCAHESSPQSIATLFDDPVTSAPVPAPTRDLRLDMEWPIFVTSEEFEKYYPNRFRLAGFDFDECACRLSYPAEKGQHAPACQAVQNGDMFLLKLLDRANVNFTLINPLTGETPIHLAVRMGRLDMVRLMLKTARSPVPVSTHGVGPLALAIKLGKFEMVKFFVKKHKYMIRQTSTFNGLELNAVFVAILAKNMRIFDYLDELDGSLVFKGPEEATGLYFAWCHARECFEVVYAAIMKHLQPLDEKSKSGLMKVFRVDIAKLFEMGEKQLLNRIFEDLNLDPLQYVLEQREIQLNPLFIALRVGAFVSFSVLSERLTCDSDVFNSLIWAVLGLKDASAFMHLYKNDKYRCIEGLTNEHGQNIVSVALHSGSRRCFSELFSHFHNRGLPLGHGRSLMEHLVLSASALHDRRTMRYLLIDFTLGQPVLESLKPAQLKGLQTMVDAWTMELAAARGKAEMEHSLTLKYIGWLGALLYRAGQGTLFQQHVMKEFPVSLADVVAFQQKDYIGHSLLLGMLVAGDLQAFDSAFAAAPVSIDATYKPGKDTLLHGLISEDLGSDSLSSVRHLVQRHNAAIDAVDCRLETPLMVAVRLGSEPVVELLLELGANAYILAPGGHNILAIAASAGANDMFNYLFERFHKDDQMPPLVLEDGDKSPDDLGSF